MYHNSLVAFLIVLFTATNVLAQQNKEWKGNLYSKDFKKFENEQFTEVTGSIIINDTELNLTDLTVLKLLKSVHGDLDIGNDFIQSFKGLENLVRVDGTLFIRKNKKLKGIQSLKSLTRVGRLNISGNPLLKNLKGIHNLTFVTDGEVLIIKNVALKDISALSKITSLNGTLQIVYNPSLTSLFGLDRIKEVQSLYIKNNSGLSNLKGLENLSVIKDELVISHNSNLKKIIGLGQLKDAEWLIIENNSALIDLEGLNSLTTVERIAVSSNYAMTGINGLEGIKNIPLDVKITNNENLTQINGLNALKEIKGKLLIDGNPKLQSLKEAFSALATIGYLNITNNASLDRLDGLNNVTNIKVWTKINENQKLTGIYGLNNLKTIGGVLEMEDNSSLTTILGFESLENVESILRIANNQNLIHLDGFGNLGTLEKLIILNNSSLQNIRALKTLKSVKRDITISKNENLENLMGLEGLIDIPSIAIYNNASLLNLKGLHSLEKAGNININTNPIQNLQGLESLKEIRGRMRIFKNPNLSDFSALSLAFLEDKDNRNNSVFYTNAYHPRIEDLINDKYSQMLSSLLTKQQLARRTKEQLGILRNEIFARKGYVFKNQYLSYYFSKKEWYHPDGAKKIEINEIEEKNGALIKELEKERVGNAYKIIQSLQTKFKENIDVLGFKGRYHDYLLPYIVDFIMDLNINVFKNSLKLAYSKKIKLPIKKPVEKESEEYDEYIYEEYEDNEGGYEIYAIASDPLMDELVISFNIPDQSFYIAVNERHYTEDYTSKMDDLFFKFKIKNDQFELEK